MEKPTLDLPGAAVKRITFETPWFAKVPDTLEPCPRREEEPDDRSIGGTTIATIVGANPFGRTPWDAWAKLTGRVPSNDAAVHPRLRWGSRHEPTILAAYAEERNPDVYQAPVGYRVTKRPHLRVSPDALAAPDLVVEAKTARWKSEEWGEEGTDQVPAGYLIQVTWYAHFLARDGWDLAALFGGSDFQIFSGRYDRELGEFLEEEAEKFWRDHVLADVPPAPEAGLLVGRYLAERFPRSTRSVLDPATEVVAAAARELCGWKLAAKFVEAREEALENALKLRIGSGAGFAGDGFKVRWTDSKRKTTDWKAAFLSLQEATDLPTENIRNIIDANSTETETRRFSLWSSPEEKARSIEAIRDRLVLPPSFVDGEQE